MIRARLPRWLACSAVVALCTVAACTLDHTGQGPEAELCGNGTLDGNEACDGAALGDATCLSLGLGDGTLVCLESCQLDTSGCLSPTCGDGSVDPGEQCDGDAPIATDCVALGFAAGTVACAADCTFDTTACIAAGCGNGVLEPEEPCDGELLAGEDCTSMGLEPGELACTADCTFDVTGCPGCGNGVREPGESCDGADLAGASCDGVLSCTADCLLDASDCTLGTVGDGADGELVVDAALGASGAGAPSFGVGAIGTADVTLQADATGLDVGDEVVLIDMQGSATACSAVGSYEFLTVAGLAGTQLSFASDVQGTYGSGGNGDLSGQKVMLARVPHFATVLVTATGSLNADPWNGATGGLLAMRVSEELRVETGGRVSADAAGFRGGSGHNGSDVAHGWPGEGQCGPAAAIGFLPNFGGGGGGKAMDPGDGCGQGGGGGAFALVGSWLPFGATCLDHDNNDPAANGGLPYGLPELFQIFLGSGGGAGGSDDDSDRSGSGGPGGGVLMLFARDAIVHGTVSSAGGAGAVSADVTDSGNGGGGSGGSIHLHAATLQGTGTVLAPGGAGFPSQNEWNNPGGDGSVGRIRIDYHHAVGEPFGSAAANDFLVNLAEPDAGYTQLTLD